MSVSMMTEFVMALKTVGITPMKFIVIMLVSDCKGFTYFYLHSENDRYIHTGSLSRVPDIA
jgi:hypothetical protein